MSQAVTSPNKTLASRSLGWHLSSWHREAKVGTNCSQAPGLLGFLLLHSWNQTTRVPPVISRRKGVHDAICHTKESKGPGCHPSHPSVTTSRQHHDVPYRTTTFSQGNFVTPWHQGAKLPSVTPKNQEEEAALPCRPQAPRCYGRLLYYSSTTIKSLPPEIFEEVHIISIHQEGKNNSAPLTHSPPVPPATSEQIKNYHQGASLEVALQIHPDSNGCCTIFFFLSWALSAGVRRAIVTCTSISQDASWVINTVTY